MTGKLLLIISLKTSNLALFCYPIIGFVTVL